MLWFGTKQEKNRLQQTAQTDESIIGTNLPTLQDFAHRLNQQTWLQSPLSLASNYLSPPCLQVLQITGMRGAVYTIPHLPSPVGLSTITAHRQATPAFLLWILITVAHNTISW